MILYSTNSQQSARGRKRFRPRQSGTAAIASLVAVITMLVSSQPSNAESRYNYDRQSYDSRGASAANNQNTSPSTAQTTTYEVHRTSRPTRTKYDECRTLCLVTVSSDQLRWLPTWRYGLQINVFVLVSDYDEPPNSVLKTCCLSAKNEMSQYRAYFVPGGVDPWGLKVYILDGTGHGKGKNSLSEQFQRILSEPNSYYEGTGKGKLDVWNKATALSNYRQIAKLKKEICRDACEAKKEGKDHTINLLGWSRGAVGVFEVARRLETAGCCCECGTKTVNVLGKEITFKNPFNCIDKINPEVNWLGMFDPVSMHIGKPLKDLIPSTIPGNVETMSVIRRTGAGVIFPKFKLSNEDKNGDQILDGAHFHDIPINHPNGAQTSHGEVGGPKSPDNVMDWMIDQARDAGVGIKK